MWSLPLDHYVQQEIPAIRPKQMNILRLMQVFVSVYWKKKGVLADNEDAGRKNKRTAKSNHGTPAARAGWDPRGGEIERRK